MSDIFFVLTPGLTVFLSPDTAQLIAASADVTMFYSVTVLMLVGHLPFCIFVGTMLIQRQVLVKWTRNWCHFFFLRSSFQSLGPRKQCDSCFFALAGACFAFCLLAHNAHCDASSLLFSCSSCHLFGARNAIACSGHFGTAVRFFCQRRPFVLRDVVVAAAGHWLARFACFVICVRGVACHCCRSTGHAQIEFIGNAAGTGHCARSAHGAESPCSLGHLLGACHFPCSCNFVHFIIYGTRFCFVFLFVAFLHFILFFFFFLFFFSSTQTDVLLISIESCLGGRLLSCLTIWRIKKGNECIISSLPFFAARHTNIISQTFLFFFYNQQTSSFLYKHFQVLLVPLSKHTKRIITTIRSILFCCCRVFCFRRCCRRRRGRGRRRWWLFFRHLLPKTWQSLARRL